MGSCRLQDLLWESLPTAKLHMRLHFPLPTDFLEILYTSGKEEDDDHDQDSLKKAFRHIWSWSSENWFLEKTKTMTMTKIPSRKPSGTYGHGPLINLFQHRMNNKEMFKPYFTKSQDLAVLAEDAFDHDKRQKSRISGGGTSPHIS